MVQALKIDPMDIVELKINNITYFMRHYRYKLVVQEPYFSYLRLQENSDFVLDGDKFIKARCIGEIEPTAEAVRAYMSPTADAERAKNFAEDLK